MQPFHRNCFFLPPTLSLTGQTRHRHGGMSTTGGRVWFGRLLGNRFNEALSYQPLFAQIQRSEKDRLRPGECASYPQKKLPGVQKKMKR